MGYAKWIGGFLGMLGGGTFGAIAGYALGSLIDNLMGDGGNYTRIIDHEDNDYKGQDGTYTGQDGTHTGGSRRRPSGYSRQEGERNAFLMSMMLLAAQVIQADGKIMHSEMEYVRQMLRTNFGESAVTQGDQILKRLFERRKQLGEVEWQHQLQQACAQIERAMSEEQRLQLLQFLCQIAKADGTVDSTEIRELQRITIWIGLNESQVNQLLNLGAKTLEQAYKVLGISPDATDEEVKKAYRKMALQHHPDKVATLGEDVRKAAEQKFKEIGEAKEMIFKARGL